MSCSHSGSKIKALYFYVQNLVSEVIFWGSPRSGHNNSYNGCLQTSYWRPIPITTTLGSTGGRKTWANEVRGGKAALRTGYWEGWRPLQLHPEFSTQTPERPPKMALSTPYKKKQKCSQTRLPCFGQPELRSTHTSKKIESSRESLSRPRVLQRRQLRPSQTSWVQVPVSYCFSKWEVSYVPWSFHQGTLPGCQENKTMQEGRMTSSPETRHVSLHKSTANQTGNQLKKASYTDKTFS